MRSVKAIIFSSAAVTDYSYLEERDFGGSLVICADGGYKHARRLGIVPDIFLGDNDSFAAEIPDGVEHVIYPPEKDKTDTNIAVDYAIGRGADEIVLIGGIGGRIDQEFTHFCLMEYALKRGVRLKMIDDINEIWMESEPFTLKKSDCRKKYVSFFAYGGRVENFSVKGLKYEAEGMSLDPGLVQASSNEFAEAETAEICFDSGTVLVMLCDDR